MTIKFELFRLSLKDKEQQSLLNVELENREATFPSYFLRAWTLIIAASIILMCQY